jgi:hypothetical protein
MRTSWWSRTTSGEALSRRPSGWTPLWPTDWNTSAMRRKPDGWSSWPTRLADWLPRLDGPVRWAGSGAVAALSEFTLMPLATPTKAVVSCFRRGSLRRPVASSAPVVTPVRMSHRPHEPADLGLSRPRGKQPRSAEDLDHAPRIDRFSARPNDSSSRPTKSARSWRPRLSGVRRRVLLQPARGLCVTASRSTSSPAAAAASSTGHPHPLSRSPRRAGRARRRRAGAPGPPLTPPEGAGTRRTARWRMSMQSV